MKKSNTLYEYKAYKNSGIDMNHWDVDQQSLVFARSGPIWMKGRNTTL